MDSEPSRLIPITVLTGFLGSGKTTVLNYMTQQDALSRTLVIINEFGEIGLDHQLMARSTDEVVVEMPSGCLCCTIRGDLARTLREAPGRFARGGKRWFDRVVIETTGLADPAPILNTLMTDAAVAQQYRLDGVVTTIDAVNGSGTLDLQIESVKQAAVADRLLLTKTDLVDKNSLSKLQKRLRVINPAAPQVIAQNGAVDAALLFDAGLYNPETKSLDVQNWLKAEAYDDQHSHHPGGGEHSHSNHDHDHHHHHEHHHHDHDDVNRHDDRIKALCVTIDDPIRAVSLEAWLDVLMMFQGENLLRIKGLINVEEIEEPLVVHAVQHIFHPPVTLDEWPTDDRRSQIVFITRDIEESTIRESLKVFTPKRPAKNELQPNAPETESVTLEAHS